MFSASAVRQPTRGWAEELPDSAQKGSKNKKASNYKCQGARISSPVMNLAQTPCQTFLTLQEHIFNEHIPLIPKPKTNPIALPSPGRRSASVLTQETECHLLSHQSHLDPPLCMGRNGRGISLKSWWKSALFCRVAAPFPLQTACWIIHCCAHQQLSWQERGHTLIPRAASQARNRNHLL